LISTLTSRKLARSATERLARIMTPPPAAAFHEEIGEANVTIWKEALFAADFLLLHSSPVYWAWGYRAVMGRGCCWCPAFWAPTPFFDSCTGGWAGSDTGHFFRASDATPSAPTC